MNMFRVFPMSRDLSHAFKGMDAEDHRVRRVLMAGAHPDLEKGRALSPTDHLLLRHVLRCLDVFKIPMSEDLQAARSFENDPDPSTVRPICILEEYGGENFLESGEKGDVVVLCNISKEDRFGHTGLPELRKSFQSARNHSDIDAWNAQILHAGAKMAFVFGVDSFEIEDFSKKDFIRIKMDGPLTCILIDRRFFEKAAYFLLDKESPLAPIIQHYDDPDVMYHLNAVTASGGTIRAFTP